MSHRIIAGIGFRVEVAEVLRALDRRDETISTARPRYDENTGERIADRVEQRAYSSVSFNGSERVPIGKMLDTLAQTLDCFIESEPLQNWRDTPIPTWQMRSPIFFLARVPEKSGQHFEFECSEYSHEVDGVDPLPLDLTGEVLVECDALLMRMSKLGINVSGPAAFHVHLIKDR